MSTRCNIIIQNKKQLKQVYHHYDGYWLENKGVGAELCNYFSNVYTGERDVEKIAEALQEFDAQYEPEDYIRLHGDIDFLFVVVLKEKYITIKMYSKSMLEYIDNIPEAIIKNKLGNAAKLKTIHNL